MFTLIGEMWLRWRCLRCRHRQSQINHRQVSTGCISECLCVSVSVLKRISFVWYSLRTKETKTINEKERIIKKNTNEIKKYFLVLSQFPLLSNNGQPERLPKVVLDFEQTPARNFNISKWHISNCFPADIYQFAIASFGASSVNSTPLRGVVDECKRPIDLIASSRKSVCRLYDVRTYFKWNRC